jgi:hypothetical protein
MKSLGGLGLIILAAIYLRSCGENRRKPIPGQLGPAFWPRAMLILLSAPAAAKNH